MNKNATQTTEKKQLSPQAKQNILIVAICLVVVAVITVSLIIALKPAEETKTLSGNVINSSSTSSLAIKNGDFELVDEENVLYPKTASSWTKYTYGSATSYSKITSADKSVMGVVDTSEDNWSAVTEDLSKYGVTVANPGVHDEHGEEDSNVYLIYNKVATTASIYSKSYTLSASTYAKVSVWIYTAGIEGENNAFVLIKSSESSPKVKTDAGTQQWYAYNFAIAHDTSKEVNGWQEFTFYVFNQSSSSSYIYCNVGLGNIYSSSIKACASGYIFVDDITLETVTANEYRAHASEITEDETIRTAYLLEATEVDETAIATSINNTNLTDTITADAYLAEASYSPFTSDYTQNIYKFVRTTQTNSYTGLELSINDVSNNRAGGDYIIHISFWVRVAQNNKVANANIYLNKDGESLGSDYTGIVTSQDIDTDTNCGWTQYHYYIKPNAVECDLSLKVCIGPEDSYTKYDELHADGTLYVTEPQVGVISYSTYKSASTGSYSKKVELSATQATTTMDNGSFSEYLTTTAQPSCWTPVFAGSNAIYNDGGKTIDGLDTTATAVEGSGVWTETTSRNDDEEQKVLRITNNVATAHGYLSEEISLSANTLYLFTVFSKNVDADAPYIYIVEESTSTAIEAKASDTTRDQFFNNYDTPSEGWVRYYVAYLTGDEAETVRVALFNGSIDGQTKSQGTVYFDQVDYKSIGTYTRDNDADEIYTLNETTNEYEMNEEKAKEITYTATDGYKTLEEIEQEIKDNASLSTLTLVDHKLNNIAEPTVEDEEEEEDEDETTTEESTVDVALLISIISSALLVGALLIVIVVKIFRKRN